MINPTDLRERILADIDALQLLYSEKIKNKSITAAEVANYIKLIKDADLVWLQNSTHPKPALSIVEALPFAEGE